MPDTKTKKTETLSHMEPGVCPGQAYFEKRDKNDREMFTEIVQTALGDVPKYMKMAGHNRMWLWVMTILMIIDTGMIIAMIITLSKIPK